MLLNDKPLDRKKEWCRLAYLAFWFMQCWGTGYYNPRKDYLWKRIRDCAKCIREEDKKPPPKKTEPKEKTKVLKESPY